MQWHVNEASCWAAGAAAAARGSGVQHVGGQLEVGEARVLHAQPRQRRRQAREQTRCRAVGRHCLRPGTSLTS